MTQPKEFKHESQDARRRDQHNKTHPEEKIVPQDNQKPVKENKRKE
ncbi:MAG: hypothetical protein WC785_01535 [Tatlockia sp.]|jgi:hypothetical protein